MAGMQEQCSRRPLPRTTSRVAPVPLNVTVPLPVLPSPFPASPSPTRTLSQRFPQVAALCILVVRGSIINGGFFSHAQVGEVHGLLLGVPGR